MKVKALLRPLALTVAVLLAAVPAMTLACQWVCAAPASAAPAAAVHHHSGHGSPAHADVPGVSPREAPAVQSSSAGCDHTGAVVRGVARASVNVLASISIPVTHAVVAPPLELRPIPVSYATHSPPGGRSAPLSLRL